MEKEILSRCKCGGDIIIHDALFECNKCKAMILYMFLEASLKIK